MATGDGENFDFMNSPPTSDGCNSNQDEFSYLQGIITQTFLLLLISYSFHTALKRLGQPTAISQMLAGVILGRTCIASLPRIGQIVFPEASMDYLSSSAAIGRMFYMFLVGLDMDVRSFLRNRRAAIIAASGAVMCFIVGGAFAPLVYWQTNAYGSRVLFAFTLMIVFTDTASPILVRMATELRLSASDLGRLAINAGVMSDLACLVLVAVVTTAPGAEFSGGKEVGLLIGVLAILVVSSFILHHAVKWLNRRNRQRKHIKNTEVVSLLLFVVGVSSITEMMGYNSMMTSFALGLVFPREGSTTRTLVNKLTYAVHNLLLPVYIGYAGVQTNVRIMRNVRYIVAVTTVVALSTFAKVGGTVIAAKYLGVPIHEGIALGFLLNVKGHVDLIILGLARRHRLWGADAFMILLVNVVLTTLMAGPAAASLVLKQKNASRYAPKGLEWQGPEAEMRILACVHSPRDAPAVLNLVEIMSGGPLDGGGGDLGSTVGSGGHQPQQKQQASGGTTALATNAYLMHLVELPEKRGAAVLYHQQEELDDGDDDEYGAGDYARQINVATDAFMVDTKIRVRQATAVATFAKMHEDICNQAANIHASVVLTPFHKFLRVDGRMVCGKEGVRTVNVKVLRHAPCTVGILVDRGLGSAAATACVSAAFAASYTSQQQNHNNNANLERGAEGGASSSSLASNCSTVSMQPFYVLALFFGGADDREAVALGSRMAMHPRVKLTVLRFLSAEKKEDGEGGQGAGITVQESGKDEEVLMAINKHEKETDADDEFLSNFYNKFVVSGMVQYEERRVQDGSDTVTAIADVESKYFLFLVGRGRRGLPMTNELRERDECPELGAVGDLLASSDCNIAASVLVLQQYSRTKDNENEGALGGDEFGTS